MLLYRGVKNSLFNMSVNLQFRINFVKKLLSFILIAGSSQLLKKPLYLLVILFENLQSIHLRPSIQLSTMID